MEWTVRLLKMDSGKEKNLQSTSYPSRAAASKALRAVRSTNIVRDQTTSTYKVYV
jgi:hypothetical protein